MRNGLSVIWKRQVTPALAPTNAAGPAVIAGPAGTTAVSRPGGWVYHLPALHLAAGLQVRATPVASFLISQVVPSLLIVVSV